MHEVLFLRDRSTPENRSLAEVAARVFAILDLSATEERESSNYEQGHYFVGYAGNVNVSVCYTDGAEMPEYPYWVVLKDPVLCKDVAEIDSSPQAVATELSAEGFQVFIPTKGWGKIDWIPSGVVYGG
jgi:hypothetical protein